MQKTKQLSIAVAKQIEAITRGYISFEYSNDKCMSVTIQVDEQYSFKMSYRDYSIAVEQILPDVVYLLSYTATVDGEEVRISKKFETEELREEYIKYNLTEDKHNNVKLSTRKNY